MAGEGLDFLGVEVWHVVVGSDGLPEAGRPQEYAARLHEEHSNKGQR